MVVIGASDKSKKPAMEYQSNQWPPVDVARHWKECKCVMNVGPVPHGVTDRLRLTDCPINGARFENARLEPCTMYVIRGIREFCQERPFGNTLDRRNFYHRLAMGAPIRSVPWQFLKKFMLFDLSKKQSECWVVWKISDKLSLSYDNSEE